MTSSITLNGTTGIVNASWTTATRPASPVAGQTGYNTDIGANETYTGSTWSISDLPAAGTSGNVLTSNGTTWTSSTPPSTSGGATTTSSATNITLTSSSNRVQNVTMTAWAKSVILPDATTLSTGGPTFQITNTGNYAFYITVNTGSSLVYLGKGQTVILSLTDKSTATGKWTSQVNELPFGFYPYSYPDGTTNTALSNQSSYLSATVNIPDASSILIQPVTSTTMLLTWIRTTPSTTGANSVYGCIATNTSGVLSYGTVVQIYNGATTAATNVSGRMLSSTAGLITVDSGTVTRVIPITVSGTTITVGTATATFGAGQTMSRANGTPTTLSLMVVDATNMLMSYYTAATTIAVRNITHNGASAPTLGTASANITVASGYGISPMVLLTSTTAQIWYAATGTTIATRIITISGSSAPTFGTAITNICQTQIVAGSRSGSIQAGSYSSTETWVALNDPFSAGYASYISYTVSGTTVTQQNYKSDYISLSYGLVGQNSLVKASSTSWVTQGPTWLSKWTYVPGDNIYAGSNMQTTPFNMYLPNAAYNYSGYQPGGTGADGSTNIAPLNGLGGISFFSGSSTTGIIAGVGVGVNGTDGNLYNPILATVFTIL